MSFLILELALVDAFLKANGGRAKEPLALIV